ncbi:MAG TPA: hypothetical protein H9850_09840 [Candidatus Anaerobiospirillum pullistercoris]|uniref:Uncharacterized protein n=1 Tax=Candidatus Anaerobiospirillum pullistercoris TaxID=2838452 RepID=A0A9D1WGI4_9GAMM|nr:hypothetical protein [Candidatus Anaerobiospirillum pullistercoris]
MKTLAYHAAMLRTKQVQEKKEQQFTLCCKLIKFALQVEVVLPVSKVFFGVLAFNLRFFVLNFSAETYLILYPKWGVFSSNCMVKQLKIAGVCTLMVLVSNMSKAVAMSWGSLKNCLVCKFFH